MRSPSTAPGESPGDVAGVGGWDLGACLPGRYRNPKGDVPGMGVGESLGSEGEHAFSFHSLHRFSYHVQVIILDNYVKSG